MKKVLYIGNNLTRASVNISAIGVLGPLLEEEGVSVVYASSKSSKLVRLFDMCFKVVFHFRKIDFVIIDTYSTQNFYYTLLVSQLCRLLKVPYIPILHGGNLPSRLKNNPRLSVLIFKNAFTNVAPSQFLKTKFEQYGYGNLKFIPNTIELKNYTFNPNRDFSSLKMLWVRSFSELYNPKLAVEVLHLLLKNGYQAELCMVGPDSDGSLCKVQAIAKDLKVDVTFTGKLTKLDWIELSKDYNVFINTTNFDNMPVSVIEAMALGIPVVSTNVGGMPHLIGNDIDGLLVAPNNKEFFLKAIEKLVEYPDSREMMALSARKKVEQFDWDQVKSKWFEVLS